MVLTEEKSEGGWKRRIGMKEVKEDGEGSGKEEKKKRNHDERVH